MSLETDPTRSGATAAALTAAHRSDWSRIVAGLIRLTGSWDLAEDCAQDAFESALTHWPADGVPNNPSGWLAVTARRRALDRLRRAGNEANKLREKAIMDELDSLARSHADDTEIPDDRLRLIFTCCHPALPLAARVALTLRTVAGLGTEGIAASFLVPTATMAQRLVRAKRKIEHAAIPYRVPSAEQLPERLHGVLAVLYLLFTHGYNSADRAGVARTAIDLARTVADLLPDAEASGLLALMLFQHSHRYARLDDAGDLVTLEEQDRRRWDRDDIAEAQTHLAAALRHGEAGQYTLQAAIAACHAASPTAEATDWSRIVLLYDRLQELTGSPVVELNRAIAVGMASSPAEGLVLLDRLAAGGRLDRYGLLPAAQADLLRRMGRSASAAERYRAAIALTDDDTDRRYLQRRLAELARPD